MEQGVGGGNGKDGKKAAEAKKGSRPGTTAGSDRSPSRHAREQTSRGASTKALSTTGRLRTASKENLYSKVDLTLKDMRYAGVLARRVRSC